MLVLLCCCVAVLQAGSSTPSDVSTRAHCCVATPSTSVCYVPTSLHYSALHIAGGWPHPYSSLTQQRHSRSHSSSLCKRVCDCEVSLLLGLVCTSLATGFHQYITMAPKKKGSSSATAAASSASSTSAATKSSAATSKQAASTSPASKQTAAAAPNPQQLPAKDQSTFKLLVRLYEQKQYKKGIKQADAILKKHPTHGETLAMKGLVCIQLPRWQRLGSIMIVHVRLGCCVQNTRTHTHTNTAFHTASRTFLKILSAALLDEPKK